MEKAEQTHNTHVVLAHVDFDPKEKQLNQQKMVAEEESFNYAMQLVNSTVLPMAMQSAIELGVFDIIDKAGVGAKLSAKDIAEQLSCKNPDAATMLDRVLRLLASHSIIDCTVIDDEKGHPPHLQRLYSMAPVTKYFAWNGGGGSLGPLMVLTQDKAILDSWYICF